jgi:CopG family transcriptional regulator, nickel-responsive regulator
MLDHDATAERFSVSLAPSLLKELDRMVRRRGTSNRSQAIADMIRKELVEHRQELGDVTIAGTITLVYDHHKPQLQSVLTDVQHDHHACIISTVHVHLDHDNCLEVLVVKGMASQVRAIADALIAAKGVKVGRLTVATTARDMELHG